MQGLIISNISNIYTVKANDKIYKCSAKGKFKKDEITPVVGDNVIIDVLDEKKSIGLIKEINVRNNYLKRPKISNITQIISVISCKNPKPDLLLLDKQIAFAEFLGVKPVIILNKMDMANKEIDRIYDIYNKIGYTAIKAEAKNKLGIDEVKKVLKNNISVFSGNSGVGKSTLINSIFGDFLTKEGNISIRNKKGKNTTTTIKLYELEENSYIADTPGFSTFDIYEIPFTELEKYFIEFKPYIKNCEFVGCTHQKEEICGVKYAVKEEQISEERYQRFIKIYEELKVKEEHRW